jgi:hypothetical protein
MNKKNTKMSSLAPPFHCTTSFDATHITSMPNYPDAVGRVNTIISYYRDVLRKLPASFPNATQHQALVRLHLGQDLMLSFRTGGGKTLVFVLAPLVMRQKCSIYSFVVPMITIRNQHVQTLLDFGWPKDCVLIMTKDNVAKIVAKIESYSFALPLIIIGSPEAFVHPTKGLCQLLPKRLRKKLGCLMIDEAQLILDWGGDFRYLYAQLVTFRRLNKTQRTVTVSGSTNHGERVVVKDNLELADDDMLVSILARMDLQLNVLETSALPPRTLPIEGTEEGSDGNDTGSDSSDDDVEINIDFNIDGDNNGGEGVGGDDHAVDDKASDAFKKIIHTNLLLYPQDGFVVYCESVDHCVKFSTSLCDYLDAHGSLAVSLPFYRSAPKWMEAVLDTYNNPEHPCRVLCCTVVLGMGVNASCNKRPAKGAFMKYLASNLSMTKQFIDRAHRDYTLHPSSYGPVFLVCDLNDFRRHMKRALNLQSSHFDAESHAVGKRLEEAACVMFSLFSNPSDCLHKLINEQLGGAEGALMCTRTDGGQCCNCRTRAAKVAAADRIRADAISVMRSDVGVATKRNAVKRMSKTFFLATRKTSHKNAAGWTKELELFEGEVPAIVVPSSVKTTVKVLVSNEMLTGKLQALVIEHLKTVRYGMPLAKLIKIVELNTGKFGLSSSQTRWCITQFLYQGMIEEDEDASPDPPGYERKLTMRRKTHVKRTQRSFAIQEWRTLLFHERFGYHV